VDFHSLLSPSFFKLVANFNLVRIYCSWNLHVPWLCEVAWGSPNLWMTPRSLYYPLFEQIFRKRLPWPWWSACGGLGLEKTRSSMGSSMGSRALLWCDQTSEYILCSCCVLKCLYLRKQNFVVSWVCGVWELASLHFITYSCGFSLEYIKEKNHYTPCCS
jgi:hypothetical protein